MAVKFPLPPDHRFGRVRGNPNIHTGVDSVSESMWLRLWQGRVRYRFPDTHLVPSGVVDGPTIRIAVALQNEAGLPETGLIDEDTWNLAWHE